MSLRELGQLMGVARQRTCTREIDQLEDSGV